MIVSNQEIHNVIDFAHGDADPFAAHDAHHLPGVTTSVYTTPFDAAPRVERPRNPRASRHTWSPLPGTVMSGTTLCSKPCGGSVEPPPYRSGHHAPLPILPGQDRGWRHTRVHDLRRQLADGRYTVIPDAVADKLIGRALCDQVSRLYDR